MDVFLWFIEEYPFIWFPALLFLLLAILLCGSLGLLLFPLMDYFIEKEGGVGLADDF